MFADNKTASSEEFLFVEAEGFDDHGGWELGQQSMDQMGSPYLLAHGLGIAVKDATTEAQFPPQASTALCIKEETSPRGVYENHLPKLKALMKQPGSTRVS